MSSVDQISTHEHQSISEEEWEQASFSFQELVRNTGFGIKVRFLLAMFFIAFVPVAFLYLFLGDLLTHVFGRDTVLILTGVLLLTVLVAISVALPIVRPIRRATRDIATTTKEVQKLSLEAYTVAQEHRLGTSILNGASKRLQGRRNSIIRDSELIAKTCVALRPRINFLLQQVQQSHLRQDIEVIAALQQGITQIESLALAIANGLAQDAALAQLDRAMESANEISAQFEDTSRQLELDSRQLEKAASSLV